MDVIGIVIIVLLALSALIGLIIGIIKGLGKVDSWGLQYLLAALLAVAVSRPVAKNFTGDSSAVGGMISIGVAVGFVLTFMGLFAILKLIFVQLKKNVVAHAEEQSLAEGKKVKPRFGAVGVFDRIFGGLALAVKGIVLTGFACAFILVFLDISQFAFVQTSMSALYSGEQWLAFKPYLMDFFIVGAVFFAVKCGYSSGITNALWTFIVIGLVVLAGLAAYHMAFNLESFKPAVTKLSEVISGWFTEMDLPENVPLMAAQIIITIGMFLLLCIGIILVAVFVPKLINFARNSKIFYVIDGIFGAFAATVLIIGLLLFVGGIIQPINDLEFMAKFTSYFEQSSVATYFYDKNILALLGAMPEIPLRDWLS